MIQALFQYISIYQYIVPIYIIILDDDDDDDHLLTRPTVGSSDSSWAAAKNANLANLEK